jgi:hypothetical protein
MHANTKAKVVTQESVSDEFEIKSGILQGDTLAPYLFIICIDYCLKKAIGYRDYELGLTLEKARSRRESPQMITDLDFVDDICLFSNNLQSAQELLANVEKWCKVIGLSINEKKTVYMEFNGGVSDNILTLASGKGLSKAHDFKYLGSHLESTCKDIYVRISLAWSTCRKLDNVWKSELRKDQKHKVFVACVESVLLYGSETWAMTKKLELKINGTYSKLLRRAYRVKWYHFISNANLFGKGKSASEKIKSRRLKLAGHCVRHPEVVANLDVLWLPNHGKRKVGRPKRNLINQLERDTGLEDVVELRSAMSNREIWKIFQQ